MRAPPLLRGGIGVGFGIMPDQPPSRPWTIAGLPAAASAARRAAEARWLALPGNVRGALWIMLAGILFTVMGAMIKAVGARLDSLQIGFFRCAFGLALILPFMLRAGRTSFRTERPFLHLWRGLLGTTAMFCGFYAVTRLPLADATAIGFASTLFMIVLAVLFLGEVVRWRRWTATIVGFAGVLVMVGPSGQGHAFPMGIALFGTLCVASVSVVIKKLSRTEPPLSILFSFGIVSTVVSVGPAVLVWQAPTPEELALMALIALLGTLGQNCGIRGYRVGEATAVAPFDYCRLLFAGLLGFLMFGDVPTVPTLAGAGLIVASTLYIARREARLARAGGPATTNDAAKRAMAPERQPAE